MIADTLCNPSERLAALRRYDILDTSVEPAFDDIARLAAHICQAPIAVINFIDEHRQWFKSEIGLGVRETALDVSICAHAILQKGLFVVPDTLLDERFRNNPLCVSDPHLRFYAGALLETPEGHALGTLCVLDYVPRDLSDAQKDALQVLSRQVMSQLELRRNLKALRASEAFARSAIESNSDCLKMLDLEGRLILMNSEGLRQMEVDDFASIANSEWLDSFSGTDREAAATALAAGRSGRKKQFRAFCPTAKGAPKWWEIIVTPILGPDGRPSGLLAVSRDMTARRQLEEQMRQTAKLESLGVMAGGIAHDFNNLLTGILGNASLLAETVSSEDRPMAQDIVSASQRAADLTKQMLAYAGKGRFEIRKLNLSVEVREILPLIKPSLGAAVNLVLKLDDNVPLIEGDPNQIQQLVANLVFNAAESLPGKSGTITILTSSLDVDAAYSGQTFTDEKVAPGVYVVLHVNDTGAGMDASTLARIFDPFFTTKFTGRGLGLAAVSGIVRAHKGAVEVETEAGKGSEFKVLFPSSSERPEPVATGHNGVILLMDTEEIVQRMAEVSLKRSGYEVVRARDGQEAIQILRTQNGAISLIVLDAATPGDNAEHTFDRLREMNPDVPIVVSSGFSEIETISRFGARNIAGIQKPYRGSQLVAKIQAVLGQNISSLK